MRIPHFVWRFARSKQRFATKRLMKTKKENPRMPAKACEGVCSRAACTAHE
jgi:hypothetical protein